MVLQSLVNLYEVLADKDKVDKQGWAKSKASYGLVVDENGVLTNVISLKTTDKSGKKEVASQISLPMPVKKSANIAANFLYGTASYLFGNDRKGNPERNKKCFEASKSLHKKLLSDDDSSAAKAILLYYENVDIANIESYLINIGCNENVITDIFKNGANLVFMPLGRLATDYNDICECWNCHYGKNESGSEICLVTGKKLPVSRLHPVIKGVRGGQSMGTSLVSFDKPAFESFGKVQGYNSPVSEYAAFAYTTALNYLLSESEYVNFFGDTTVVCWTEDDNEGCQDIFANFFGNSEELKQKDLWDVIKKLSMGQSVEWNSIPINPDVKFYILGLSPNAARLSVRFFLVNSFGNFMKNVVEHEENMRIVIPSFLQRTHFPAWKVLRETVNQNSKNKSAKPQLAGSYIYSILTGYKYPATLYDNIMIRIKAERDVNAEREAIRAAVIKAFLIRNYPEYKEVLTVSINNDTNNQAYNLGRLFSILEEIQSVANPTINSTIKDRYFSSASSTPGAIFPFLLDLAQKHIKKIRTENQGFCIAKQKEITDILSRFEESFPARMTMQEKGAFQIGYYHQVQKRYTKKEDK
ncbi:type I-C CRISPR-associated protein Cas8c/Csd1 [uncultured Ruminococcus sp.]|uniref:type I-C CRISPR-associated protein Cas8c/Csd1 n=1 Tax=uncultured Ruminococcus sp. TaxID=165186 RepID=UPI0025EA041A|nr:type I-C CRISPR-associated protein Cas8c/Csd1 [uncultured Ruminococcus sp.]